MLIITKESQIEVEKINMAYSKSIEDTDAGMAKKQGKLLIFTAPSGAGKTTLVKHLLTCIDDLIFSVSATTRSRRHNETDGKDYYFIGPKLFEEHIAKGDFVEYEEVYGGTYYGTLKSEVERQLKTGRNVIFDVDVQGALNLKKHYKDKALAVFVEPPSVAVLEERLRRRASETEATLRKRIDKAASEIAYAPQFDVSILNDDLNEAKQNVVQAVTDFLKNN